MEKVIIGDAELYCGDCRDLLPRLNAGTIDSVYTDPPYYQVKGDFDFEFEDFTEFQALIDYCGKEWKRVLPKNGNVYVFGHAKIIAYVQIILDQYFNLENSLVWEKLQCQTRRGVEYFRCYAPVTERCLFYSNEVERTGLEEIKLDIDNFKPLRAYFEALRSYVGLSKAQIVKQIGQTADHAFRYSSTQWDLPTRETYGQIKSAFQCEAWEGWREYEDLRREYEDLRREYEDLRRPFNNVLRLTDVIENSQESHISGKYDHETIKPVTLMEKLIITSTKSNHKVLDCFMGTGTTGIAAVGNGRRFIGIERERKYFDIACERIEMAQAQGRLAL